MSIWHTGSADDSEPVSIGQKSDHSADDSGAEVHLGKLAVVVGSSVTWCTG
jgi:hypothetical protein